MLLRVAISGMIGLLLRMVWANAAAMAIPTAAIIVLGLTSCSTIGSLTSSSTITVPPVTDDACSDARQSFYADSQRAVSAEDNRKALDEGSGFLKGQGGKIVTGLLGSRVPGAAAVTSKLGPLLDSLAKNAKEDTTLIRQFSASFSALTACRRNQIAALRRDVGAHRMGRAEARERAASIKQLAVVDAGVARDVNARLSARNRQFQVAIDDLDTRLPAEQRQAAARSQQSRPSQQSEQIQEIHQTVQTNQRALTTQAATVEMSVNDAGFNISQLWLPAPSQVRHA